MDDFGFSGMSAANYFGQLLQDSSSDMGALGSGTFELPGFSPEDAIGAFQTMNLPADAGNQDFANFLSQNEGITGIEWIDNILGRVGRGFEKDPLGTIAAGVGILSKIKDMRSGGGSPAAGQMAKMIRENAGQGGNGGGGAGTVPAMPAAVAVNPSQMIANIPQIQAKYVGPLTQTHYNGRK